jgi:hypothetical protein
MLNTSHGKRDDSCGPVVNTQEGMGCSTVGVPEGNDLGKHGVHNGTLISSILDEKISFIGIRTIKRHQAPGAHYSKYNRTIKTGPAVLPLRCDCLGLDGRLHHFVGDARIYRKHRRECSAHDSIASTAGCAAA